MIVLFLQIGMNRIRLEWNGFCGSLAVYDSHFQSEDSDNCCDYLVNKMENALITSSIVWILPGISNDLPHFELIIL